MVYVGVCCVVGPMLRECCNEVHMYIYMYVMGGVCVHRVVCDTIVDRYVECGW